MAGVSYLQARRQIIPQRGSSQGSSQLAQTLPTPNDVLRSKLANAADRQNQLDAVGGLKAFISGWGKPVDCLKGFAAKHGATRAAKAYGNVASAFVDFRGRLMGALSI